MTKAERIFKKTMYATRNHIINWGYNPDIDGGWSGGWCTETDENPEGELIYQRTQNQLLKMLKSEEREIQMGINYNIYEGKEDKLELRVKTLQMMQKTANNQYIAGK